ncbi:ubiquitin carboxyl-terminal hydrolase calypso isoform X2 [Patella vulgata]|uniref:ubiquitin carboxyl-terminal hydrolase calypso isoform X2 n=1 Tax=Patella vulgata TaxID=6465 RepID=UPI002180464E|nr:ubiquitin carboxyl-terminal hydrolase calypso isoform X2 [Patella vulgata]
MNMSKGWLELESDPGLFTLLLEDFGVNGVQVEEIYDLQKKIDGPVYGFIFLFRWIEERRCRRKTSTEVECFVREEDTVNSIFFAQQIIPNSCATHALLSVLLNSNKVSLGENLNLLKQFSDKMSPENKGLAIGNMPALARAHNSHARPEPRHLPEKQPGLSTVKTGEAFHFVSYVPINGSLFELDGLKPYPIDHGPWEKEEEWTEKFLRVITDRLGMAKGGEPNNDIRYNLMAVVPDKRQLYENKLKTLKTNRQIVLEALQQMVKVTSSSNTAIHKDNGSPNEYSKQKDIDISQSNEKTLLNDNVNTPLIKTEVESTLDDHKMDQTDAISIRSVSEHVSMETDVSARKSTDTTESSVKEKNVKIQISVSDENDGNITNTIPRTVSLTDVTKPLTIETKFACGSGPSSESTDTASEAGSGFSSPGSFHIPSCQSSPQFLNEVTSSSDACTIDQSQTEEKMDVGDGKMASLKNKHKSSNHNGFKPKDLVSLLKNVEKEINTCETNLKEENEKRKKYKIDDCRRTHNYDEFITLFLSMLAEQGLLHSLVEEHVNNKKRTNIGRLQSKTLTSADKKRRTKTKKRR